MASEISDLLIILLTSAIYANEESLPPEAFLCDGTSGDVSIPIGCGKIENGQFFGNGVNILEGVEATVAVHGQEGNHVEAPGFLFSLVFFGTLGLVIRRKIRSK